MNIFDGLHLAYAAIILILGCYVANKSASLATLFNEVSPTHDVHHIRIPIQ